MQMSGAGGALDTGRAMSGAGAGHAFFRTTGLASRVWPGLLALSLLRRADRGTEDSAVADTPLLAERAEAGGGADGWRVGTATGFGLVDADGIATAAADGRGGTGLSNDGVLAASDNVGGR